MLKGIALDIEQSASAIRKYSNCTLSFVLFTNGSFCMFQRGSPKNSESAISSLKGLMNRHVDCVVREMNDGNYLVNFGDPIFGLVLKKVAEKIFQDHPRENRELVIAIHAKKCLHLDLTNPKVEFEL